MLDLDALARLESALPREPEAPHALRDPAARTAPNLPAPRICPVLRALAPDRVALS
jgi:hypothetical protein